jgi:hypothetical protein
MNGRGRCEHTFNFLLVTLNNGSGNEKAKYQKRCLFSFSLHPFHDAVVVVDMLHARTFNANAKK